MKGIKYRLYSTERRTNRATNCNHLQVAGLQLLGETTVGSVLSSGFMIETTATS